MPPSPDRGAGAAPVNADLVICADTRAHPRPGPPPVQAVAIARRAHRRHRHPRRRPGLARSAHRGGRPRRAPSSTPGLTDGHMHPVMGLQLTADVDLSTRPLARRGPRARCRPRPRAGRRTRGCRPGAWTPTSSAAGRSPAPRSRRPSAAARRFVRLFDAHSALATAGPCAIAGVTGPRQFAQRSEVVCDDDGRPTGLLLEMAAMDLVLGPRAARPGAGAGRPAARPARTTWPPPGSPAATSWTCSATAQAVVAAAEELGDLPLRLRFAPWCVPGVDADGLAELVDLQRRGGRRWAVGGGQVHDRRHHRQRHRLARAAGRAGRVDRRFWPDPARVHRAPSAPWPRTASRPPPTRSATPPSATSWTR